jgi:hypothetical protein
MNKGTSNNCAMGVLAPNRNSKHGSAKNKTKLFSPGMASMLKNFSCTAAKPANTNAKKGKVTHKTVAMGGIVPGYDRALCPRVSSACQLA